MDYNNNNDFTWMETSKPPKKNKNANRGCPISVVVVLLVITIVATVMFTFTLTSEWVKAQDYLIIQEQQQAIENLQDALESGDEFTKLDILASLLEQYSYYSNEFNKEQMLEEVLRAYTYATGDNYADYFTEEEYAALSSDNAGAGVGIGVSVVQEPLIVNGQEFLTFNIIAIFKGAPAANSELRVGDRIYAVEVEGEFKSIAQLGGYDQALVAIRGEVGSTAKLLAFRSDSNGGYTTLEVAIVRDTYTKESVTYRVSETDPKVGIVHLAEFDLQTPAQFNAAVKDLQAKGVERFIFDVRNNPGGDLQSIRAVLSYILEEGDLILNAINNKGEVDGSVYAEIGRAHV